MPDAAFHDIRFPTDVSFGATGGPERRTDVVTLASGFEARNATWAHSRRRYDAGFGLRSLDDVAELVAFFEARRGRLYGFRWKDWSDFQSCAPSGRPSATDQRIGIGDGLTTGFALAKSYRSGGEAYRRPIALPVAGSVLVAVNGVAVSATMQGGLVVLAAAPAAGAVVSAGFAFDVPVRFDSDRLEVSAASFATGVIPSVPLLEVRL